MKSVFYTVGIIVALLLAGCGSMRIQGIEIPDDVPSVIVDPRFKYETRTSHIGLGHVELIGDVLVLNISYSGGCEEHKFSLVSKGDYSTTYPPEIRIKLMHDDKGDRCRSMIDEKKYFDISGLRNEGTNKVLLILTNNDQTHEYLY